MVNISTSHNLHFYLHFYRRVYQHCHAIIDNTIMGSVRFSNRMPRNRSNCSIPINNAVCDVPRYWLCHHVENGNI